MSFLFGDGSKQNAKAQQDAIDKQTALAQAEYAKRSAQQASTTKDINTLRSQGFDASASLNDQDFTQALKTDADAFGKTTAIADAATGKVGAAYGANADANKGAFLQLGDVTDAERARQAGIQGQATGVVGSLTPQLAMPAFMQRQGADAATAGDRINSTLTAPTPTAVGTDNSPFAAELAKYTTAGYDRGAAGARGIAGTNAYGTSATEGDHAVSTAGSDLNSLKAQSEASAAALPAEQHPSEVRKANAAQDLASMLDLISNEKNKNTSRVADTRAGQDKSRVATNTALAQAIKDLYSGKVGAQNDFLSAFLDASKNYENTGASLTNQKIGLTKTSAPLISTLGDQAISAGISAAMK